MVRSRKPGVAALMLVLSAAGCVGPGPSGPAAPAPARAAARPADRYLTGVPEEVQGRLPAVLSEMGVLANVTREGAAIRVQCHTKGERDARFSLVLTAVPGGEAGRTRVHVGWEEGPEPEDGLDDPLVGQVLERLAARPGR